QVEPEPQPLVREQRARHERLLGHEVGEREEREERHREQRTGDPPAELAHDSSSFFTFVTDSTFAREIFTRTDSPPLSVAISIVSTSSAIPTTMPRRPPTVTSGSFISIALIWSSRSRCRFCCGRIIRK